MLAFHGILPASLSKASAKELVPGEPERVWEEGCFIRRFDVGGNDTDVPATGAQPPRVKPECFQSPEELCSLLLVCHLPYTQVAVTSLPPPFSILQTTAGTLSQTGAGQVAAGNKFFRAFLWLCPRLTSSVRFSIDLPLHSVSLEERNKCPSN